MRTKNEITKNEVKEEEQNTYDESIVRFKIVVCDFKVDLIN